MVNIVMQYDNDVHRKRHPFFYDGPVSPVNVSDLIYSYLLKLFFNTTKIISTNY